MSFLIINCILNITLIIYLTFTGQTFYEEKAEVSIVVEKKLIILCKDVIEGVLVLFLVFYVFGYSYPDKIYKTLEFIQRYINIYFEYLIKYISL